MATIAKKYDVYNRPAKRMREIVRPYSLVTSKKSGLERALEEENSGLVTKLVNHKNAVAEILG